MNMELGMLVLRIVVGGLFAGHGAQKLFGWFGGAGPEGTGRFFDSVGLRPGRTMALLAGLAELTGGVLFALGLVTPLAAALLIAVMSTAIATMHWPHGVWASKGGFEYNLVLIAVAFATTSIGAGDWSLDHVLNLHVAGPEWALGALLVGLLAAIGAVTLRRLRTHRTAGATPASA
jgi:putative oxidoreductase